MRGLLRGGQQSSDRGEVGALVAAVGAAGGQVEVVTDNMYVEDKAESIKAGGEVNGAHCDLGERFRDNVHVLGNIR